MPFVTSGNYSDLARIAQLWPNAAWLRFEGVGFPGCAGTELAAALAPLPDGCWPAVNSISRVPAPAAAQLARLWPLLKGCHVCAGTCCAGTGAGTGAALAAALERLAAAAATLNWLTLDIGQQPYTAADARRAGQALGRLRGLDRLEVTVDGEGPEGSAQLLQAALPGLSALTALSLTCSGVSSDGWLGALAPSLRELSMDSDSGVWMVETLVVAPPLTGLTLLVLECG